MQLEQLELTGGGTLTLYLRESVEAMPHFRQRPLVLVVPGGGYNHVSPREGDPVALQFAAAGYHTAVLHYAVGDSARDALPMRQLAQAIGLVRQHAAQWNILPDKIALCGFSAGGHLALSGAVWDIPGMADQPRPNALLLANAAFDAVMKIGWPEGRIPLAEAVVYLATSPKSNSAYNGINTALEMVRKTGNQPVPLHLRNAPTALMRELGYHDGYKYAHDYPENFVQQQYMPDALTDTRLWQAQHSPAEDKLYQRMVRLWGDRYK